MDCQHWIACSTVMFSSSFTLDLIRHTQREKKVAIKNGGRLVSFIISTLGQPGSEVGSFFAHPIPPSIGPTISWILIWFFIMPFHNIFSWILIHATEQLCFQGTTSKLLTNCGGKKWWKTHVYYHFNFSIFAHPIQVNLCQKFLFLHQLNQNMMTDCSLFMKIVSSKYLQNMLCTQIVVFVLFWHSEQFWYTTCSADVASFWKRFTFTL